MLAYLLSDQIESKFTGCWNYCCRQLSSTTENKTLRKLTPITKIIWDACPKNWSCNYRD